MESSFLERFQKRIELLAELHQIKPPSPEAIRYWHSLLSNWSEQEVMDGLNYLARTSTCFPTPSMLSTHLTSKMREESFRTAIREETPPGSIWKGLHHV